MLILNLLIGCIGFFLAGIAITQFKSTKNARWAIIGSLEILIGCYYVVAAIGDASTSL